MPAAKKKKKKRVQKIEKKIKELWGGSRKGTE